MDLIGIGKENQLNSISNWTDGNNASVCADAYPFEVWSEWSANQRDLFILNIDGDLIFHENITSGIPDTLENFIFNQSNISIDDNLLTNQFLLYQNYPNPFNPITRISYDLPEASDVTISIYNMMGRKIKNLINTNQSTGYKSVIWNGTNDNGEMVSGGMYLYRLKTNTFRETKKMILLK